MLTITTKRANQIARNINAMDIHFERCDDRKVYRFWRNLKKTLENILSNLSDEDKKLVITLCDKEKLSFFNLVEVKEIEENSISTFRTKVFNYAWQIVKSTGKTFKMALIEAWKVYKLRKTMLNEIGKNAFLKRPFLDPFKNGYMSFKIENLVSLN